MTAAATVLIVDDEPDIRRLVRTRLDPFGKQVVEAATAAEAISAAAAARPEVIVLDWEMPEMTGLEALPILRRVAPRARIFMFSARSAAEAASAAVAAGADGYFEKSRLAALIAAVVEASAEIASDATTSLSAPANRDGGSRLPRSERPFRLLVVDDDPIARKLLRLAVELEGAVVTESASLAAAEAALEDDFDGVILDRRLPDGDGLDLLPLINRRSGIVRVVVCSNVDDDREPSWVLHVPKTNMDGVVAALGLTSVATGTNSLFNVSVGELVAEWRARCRMSGLGELQILAESIIEVLTAAQGAGLASSDEELEGSLAARAPESVPVEEVLQQLHCLRQVLLSHLVASHSPSPRDAVTITNRVIDRVTVALVTGAAARLRHEAFTDPLTGLLNRRAFDEALEVEVKRAARYHRPFSVVMIDVDGLKQVNDSAGHAAGDAVLKAMAEGLQQAIRTTDSVYRVGGDEFVMLLPETPKHHVADVVARLAGTAAPPSAGVPRPTSTTPKTAPKSSSSLTGS